MTCSLSRRRAECHFLSANRLPADETRSESGVSAEASRDDATRALKNFADFHLVMLTTM